MRILLKYRQTAVLLLCVLGAGAVSLMMGKDVNWDLKNYHYYNAYSLVKGRLGWDIGPAQIQGYFNPIGDLPFYFLVEFVKSPRAIAVLMSLWSAVGAFFLVRIAALIFPPGMADRGFGIAAAAAIGLTGVIGIAMVGSTMNEWQSSALVMASLYLVLRTSSDPGGASLRPVAIAGLLAGVAVGLKLTFGAFALGLLAASAVHVSRREGLRRVIACGSFLFAGFLISYGPWAVTLWREFGNPFFPLFNAWFQSPYWEPVNFMDRNYGPRSALQAVLFPLLVNDNYRLTTELDFSDYRLAALYSLSIACLARLAWRRTPSWPSSLVLVAAGAFALVSYLAWLKVFGIYRYLLPLEILSGPLIAACVMSLVSNSWARRITLVAVAALLVVTVQRPDWGRLPFGNRYFETSAPALPADSLVIMGRHEPMSYAIAFFRPDARFVAPSNLLLDFGQSNLLARRVKELIATHPGPLYSLDFAIHHVRTDADLARSGLRRDAASCLPVISTLDESAMRLCRVERMAK
jgi:hypothetical protein